MIRFVHRRRGGQVRAGGPRQGRQLGWIPPVAPAHRLRRGRPPGEALAHEVYRFGVRVVNVEPGVIMTSIFENSAEQTRYDKTSPYQPIMRRNGKVFSAGFKRAVSPDLVAETILESITTDEYKLRWPVGPDAEGFMAARTTVPSEEWIAMGADLTDDEYNEKFKSLFGIDL